MKIIRTLVTIGMILAIVYVFFLMISFIQIANERAICRTTPLDQLNRADFQYCLSRELK